MPNVFSARDRAFISSLAGELHLTLTWDEYDDNNQNLVTWHLPGATEELPTVPGEQNGGDEVAEDDEAMAAVKRLLKKYDNAPVVDVDEEGDFDVRHDRRVKERMDEWKGTYYKVRVRFVVAAILLMSWKFRTSSKYLTTIPHQWISSSSDISKVYNGSCIIILVELLRGVGFTITITHLASRVCLFILTEAIALC